VPPCHLFGAPRRGRHVAARFVTPLTDPMILVRYRRSVGKNRLRCGAADVIRTTGIELRDGSFTPPRFAGVVSVVRAPRRLFPRVIVRLKTVLAEYVTSAPDALRFISIDIEWWVSPKPPESACCVSNADVRRVEQCVTCGSPPGCRAVVAVGSV